MHGVKRSRISPQAAEAKRLKELSKIEAYVTLQQDVLARKKHKDYTREAFDKTTALLDLNFEFYTIWNYRRDILLHGLFPSSSPIDIVSLLTSDLKLTTAYLQVHPKVYWIWNHRKWCLENVPLGPGEPGTEQEEGWRCGFWKGELALVEMMLDGDARNFHAWDYRRYILRSLPKSFKPAKTPASELAYTRRKIESNFSNFSAWHSRTKLLGSVWEQLGEEDLRKERDKEFELVTQALWTDPNDQSGWLYHRWLVGTNPQLAVLKREIQSIRELHETEPDSKWCMNALAHYLLLLARHSETAEDDSEMSKEQARNLYHRLEAIDGDRKERYRDMAAL